MPDSVTWDKFLEHLSYDESEKVKKLQIKGIPKGTNSMPLSSIPHVLDRIVFHVESIDLDLTGEIPNEAKLNPDDLARYKKNLEYLKLAFSRLKGLKTIEVKGDAQPLLRESLEKVSGSRTMGDLKFGGKVDVQYLSKPSLVNSKSNFFGQPQGLSNSAPNPLPKPIEDKLSNENKVDLDLMGLNETLQHYALYTAPFMDDSSEFRIKVGTLTILVNDLASIDALVYVAHLLNSDSRVVLEVEKGIKVFFEIPINDVHLSQLIPIVRSSAEQLKKFDVVGLPDVSHEYVIKNVEALTGKKRNAGIVINCFNDKEDFEKYSKRLAEIKALIELPLTYITNYLQKGTSFDDYTDEIHDKFLEKIATETNKKTRDDCARDHEAQLYASIQPALQVSTYRDKQVTKTVKQDLFSKLAIAYRDYIDNPNQQKASKAIDGILKTMSNYAKILPPKEHIYLVAPSAPSL